MKNKVFFLVACVAIFSSCTPKSYLFLGLTSKAGSKCVQSKAVPGAKPNCVDGNGGEVCIQRVGVIDSEIASNYLKGKDFLTNTVKLEVQWCPNENCNENEGIKGGRIDIVVDTKTGGGGALVFHVDCETPTLIKILGDVERIKITRPTGLMSLPCNGAGGQSSYGRWQICDYKQPLLLPPIFQTPK